LHEAIHEDAYAVQAPRTVVVYLGDYIDRGPDSRGVIEILVEKALPGFESVWLMGNHEAAMLDFLDGREGSEVWLGFGGVATLESYGVRPPARITDQAVLTETRAALAAALPPAHQAFLKALRMTHQEGDYFFVHAGVRPGVALDRQVPDDLLWIRNEFLRSRADFGKIVVHGHTIVDEPDVQPNRIGIDTGAFATDCLTCLVVDGCRLGFLST
jgi:serine/threonine protein phosphatase 1